MENKLFPPPARRAALTSLRGKKEVEGCEVERSGANCGAVVRRGRGGRRKWCRVPEAKGPRINSWWSGFELGKGLVSRRTGAHEKAMDSEAEGRGFDSQRTGSMNYYPETLPIMLNKTTVYVRAVHIPYLN